MATYPELVALAESTRLLQQIKMGVSMAALAITNEPADAPNHLARVQWAKAALAEPDKEVQRVVWHVLAANSSATVAQINAAPDALVQDAVTAAVNLFAA